MNLKVLFENAYKLASPYLPKYLQSFTKKEISTGIKFENIVAVTDNINEAVGFDLLKFSNVQIGSIILQLPEATTSTTTATTVIEIQNSRIELIMTDQDIWNKENLFFKKMKFIETFINKSVSKLSQDLFNDDGLGGFAFLVNSFKGIVHKYIDNIKLSLINTIVVFSFEDISFALTIDKAEFFSTDKDFEYAEYSNENDTSVKMKYKSFAISNINVIFQDNKTNHQSTILPGLHARMNISLHSDKCDCMLTMSKISLNVEKEVYSRVIGIINRIMKYKRKLFEHEEKAKFLFYRPLDGKSNWIAFWKYAIRMIIKLNKYYRGNLNTFSIPHKEKKALAEEFQAIFPLFMKDTNDVKLLQRIKFLVSLLEKETLLPLLRPYIEERILVIKKEKNKPGLFTGFANLFSNPNVEKNKTAVTALTSEEIKKIEECMTQEWIYGIMNNNTKSNTNSPLDFLNVYLKPFEKFKINFDIPNIQISLTLNPETSFLLSFAVQLVITDSIQSQYGITIQNISSEFNANHKTFPVIINSIGDAINLNFEFKKYLIKKKISISAFIGQFEIVLNSQMYPFFMKFVKCKINKDLLHQIVKNWNYMKDASKNAMVRYADDEIDMEINITPRSVYIPLNENDLERMSNIELIQISFNEIKLSSSSTSKNKYEVNFQGIQVSHFISFPQRETQFQIIKDFPVEIKFEIAQEQEELVLKLISTVIPFVDVNLTANLINVFNKLISLFKPSKKGILDFYELTFEEIASKSSFNGHVMKKNNNFWGQYDAYIYSGLLIFLNPNESDEEKLQGYCTLGNMHEDRDRKVIEFNECCLNFQNYSDEYFSQWVFYLTKEISKYQYQVNTTEDTLQESNMYLDDLISMEKIQHASSVKFSCMVKVENVNLTFYGDERAHLRKILTIDLHSIEMFTRLITNKEHCLMIQISNATIVNHFSLCYKILECQQNSKSAFMKLEVKINFQETLTKIAFGDFILSYEPNLVNEILVNNIFTVLNSLNHFDFGIEKTNVSCEFDPIKKVDLSLETGKVSVYLINRILQCPQFLLNADKFNFSMKGYSDHTITVFHMERVEVDYYQFRDVGSDKKIKLLSFEERIQIDLEQCYSHYCKKIESEIETKLRLHISNPRINIHLYPIVELMSYISTEISTFNNNQIIPEMKISLCLALVNPEMILKAHQEDSDRLIFAFHELNVSNYYDIEENLNLNFECKGLSLYSAFMGCQFMIFEEGEFNIRLKAIPRREWSYGKNEIAIYSNKLNIYLRQIEIFYILTCIYKNLGYQDENCNCSSNCNLNSILIPKFKEQRKLIYLQSEQDDIKEEILTLSFYIPYVQVNLIEKIEMSADDYSVVYLKLSNVNVTAFNSIMLKSQNKCTNLFIEVEGIDSLFFDSTGKREYLINSFCHTQEDDCSMMTVDENTNINKINEYRHIPKNQVRISFEFGSKKKILNFHFYRLNFLIRADAVTVISSFFIHSIPDIWEYRSTSTTQHNGIQDLELDVDIIDSSFTLQTGLRTNVYIDNPSDIISLIIGEIRFFYSTSAQSLIDANAIKQYGEGILEVRSLEIFISKPGEQHVNKRTILSGNEDALIVKFCLNLKNYIDDTQKPTYTSSLIVNLSYKDILTFMKAVNLNLYYIANEKRIQMFKAFGEIYKNKNKNNQIIKQRYSLKETLFSELDSFAVITGTKTVLVTLIDDDSGVYCPFLSIQLDDIHVTITDTFTMNPWTSELDLEASCFAEMLSYNYISGVWEPMMENILCKIGYKQSIKKSTVMNWLDLKITDSVLNWNISDMTISFISSSMSRWIKKLLLEKEKYEKEIANLSALKENVNVNENEEMRMCLISNHSVQNLTGKDLVIRRKKKDYTLQVNETLDLEYINPVISSTNIIEISFPSSSSSSSSYQELELSNPPNLIRIDKLGAQFNTYTSHLIDPAYSYFISEVTCLKNKRLCVTLYSPIVFYNKTDIGFLLNLSAGNSSSYMIPIVAKGKIGIPHEALLWEIEIINPLTNESSEMISLAEILNSRSEYEYFKEIKIGRTILNLHRNLDRSLNNVREIQMTFSYIIRNCLPFDLFIGVQTTDSLVETATLAKSEKIVIDYISLQGKLMNVIEIPGGCRYSSGFFNLYPQKKSKEDEVERVRLFQLEEGDKKLYLSYAIVKDKPKSHREIAIYSKFIFINGTSIRDIKLLYDHKREVERKLIPMNGNEKSHVFVYNNNIEQDPRFYIMIDDCVSDWIMITDVIAAGNYFVKCSSKTQCYEFVIRSSLSNLPNVGNKHEICCNVLTISPTCVVHNEMEMFNLHLCLPQDTFVYDTIPCMSSCPFYFFSDFHGKSTDLLVNVTNSLIGDTSYSIDFPWSCVFSFANLGLFTIPISSGKDINYINIEIRPSETNFTGSNDVIDVYVYEADITNAQLVVENFTKENIIAYQDNFKASGYQIIPYEGIYIIPIYDYTSSVFAFEIGGQVVKYSLDDRGACNVTSQSSVGEYPCQEKVSDDVIVKIDSNGMKGKFKFEGSSDKQMMDEEKVLRIDVCVSSLGISLITDNEHIEKKFRNYQRYELMYIYLEGITADYTLQSTREVTSIEQCHTSELSIIVNNLKIDNQLSIFAKYPRAITQFTQLQNNIKPFFQLNVSSQIYPEDQITRIKHLKYDINPISIGVDSEFVDYIISFVNNIIYRMNIANFNVDTVLLIDRRDEKITCNYQPKAKHHRLCAKKIEISDINLYVSISEYGFKQFLRKHLNIGGFFISLINNLTADKIRLSLNGVNIVHFYGTAKDILNQIVSMYQSQLISKIYKMGFKSIFLGILKIFQRPEEIAMVQSTARHRIPRAFYGKYKSIKFYDDFHAQISERIRRNELKNAQLFHNFIFHNCISFINTVNKKQIVLLFSNSGIIFIENKTMWLEPFHSIDYFYIQSANAIGNEVKISYNQAVDGVICYKIQCPSEDIARKIAGMVSQSTEENIGEFFKLN